MKILHAYCLNHNLGDYYLGMGVKNLLRAYLPVDLIAETNLQGTVFNEYYIQNVVNKKYDLLVIGGGGIIHGAHWPNGWFWLIEQQLLKTIKVPFIVYGAGYNYFADEGGIPEVGKAHLLETIQRAAWFSVRNDGSFARLKKQLDTEIPVVPDPGFHINLNRQFDCSENDDFVMVQLANDKAEYRFHGSSGQHIFINQLRDVIKDISRRYKVIIAPHVYDDVDLSIAVAKGLENVEIWDFKRFAFDRSSESVGYYQNAKFVMAMRGHGQIVPFAFNTPVISLENHPKHFGLMRTMEVHEYNVAIRTADFGQNLRETTAKLEKSIDNYREHLKRKNRELLEHSQKAFAQISEVIRPRK